MLEGLMQHDHPLTLQLVLERMRGMNGDAEVVTFTGDGTTRTSYAEVGDRVDRLCRGLQELGVEQGDRVATFAWNSQLPPRGLPRGAVHGGRAAHPEHPPLPRAARLRGQPRAGQGDPRGRLARGRARAARRSVRDGRALRRDGRGRPLEAAGGDQLRGAARAPGAGVRLPGDRRPGGGRAVLHERDDRQPEGRPLLPPLEHPAHDGAVHGRRDRGSAAPTASSRSCRCSTPTRGGCPTRPAWRARA